MTRLRFWKHLLWRLPCLWLSLAGTVSILAETAGQFRFAVADYSTGENNAMAIITVTRVGGAAGKVIVPFSTSDGTALDQLDYLAATNKLVFDDFQTRAQFSVSIFDNADENPAKTVNLTLYPPELAEGEDLELQPELGDISEAVLNILDDDTKESFNFRRKAFVVDETAGQIEIEVIFKGDVGEGVSVTYETVQGSFRLNPGSDYATETDDYTPVTGTLTFTDGAPQIITVPIQLDDLVEFNEDFAVRLSNPRREGAPADPPLPDPVLGELAEATVTILFNSAAGAPRPAGAVDLEFNADNDPRTFPPSNKTPGANQTVYALALQPDGKLFLGGEFTSVNALSRNRIARVDTNGWIDLEFDPGTGANDYVSTIAVYTNGQDAGKVLIGGGFTAINAIQRHGVARLMQDGSLDISFFPGQGANGPVHTVALTPEGILIGGEFTHFNGIPRKNLARLNNDGSLDSTFDPGAGPNGPIHTLAVQAVGALFHSATNSGTGPFALSTNFNVGPSSGYMDLEFNFFESTGSFRVYQGMSNLFNSGLTNNMVIVQTNGMTITNFPPIQVRVPFEADPQATLTFVVNEEMLPAITNQPPVDPASFPWEIRATVFPDVSQSIVVGGDFTTFNGQPLGRIARLNIDGSLEPSFQVRSGANGPIHAIALQSDDKILVGGAFSAIDGVRREKLARLNSDGMVDRSFHPGSGPDHPVFALKLQADGRILAGGAFTSVNGVRRMGLARFLEDGAVDTSFLDTAYNQFAGITDPDGRTPIGFVKAIDLQADGNVLIGGNFTHLGGGLTRMEKRPRYNFARLVGGETPGPGNIEFQFSQFGVDENGGPASITLVRNSGSLGQVSVDFTNKEGVALAEVDFHPETTKVTWNSTGPLVSLADTNFVIVNVRISDDRQIEGDETFEAMLATPRGELSLGGEYIPTGPSLGRIGRSTVTIIENDLAFGTIEFDRPEFTVVENAGIAVVRIKRTGGATGLVSVRYATSDGTAQSGSDFTSSNGLIFFSSGQTERTLSIPIWDNTRVEEDKEFQFRLFSPGGGATVGPQSAAVVTIIDDDFKPGRIALTTTNFIALEDSRETVISVERRGGSAGLVSVRYSTRDGTAQAPFDFMHAAGLLTWNDGETGTKTFSVPLNNNGIVSGNKTVQIVLSNPSLPGALGGQSDGWLTIEDDDAYGEISFNSAEYLADENGGVAIVNVIRRHGSAGQVSVQFATTAATARPGEDYEESSGLLIFQPGETSKTFLVPIVDNAELNGERTVALGLTNPSGAVLGQPATAVLTLLDDELAHQPAGSVDRDFRIGDGPNDAVLAVALQPDHQLLIAGSFTAVGPEIRRHIARLTADGNLDVDFDPETGADGPIHALVLQDEGRIVLGGAFTMINNRPFHRLARLTRRGLLDTTFNPGAGADQAVNALADLGTYELLIGGAFNTYDSQTRRHFARLNSDATLDLSFAPSAAANAPVYAAAALPDGKVIVGGEFTDVNGVSRRFVARLNSDGTVDTSFDSGPGTDGTVRAIVVQNDGKILLGGNFRSVAGVPRNSIARLNADGSLDLTFDPGSGANGPVYAIALHGNGKIVAGGDFTTFRDVTRNRIVRLNEDGSLDATINFGSGANGFIAALAIQNDRKIVAGGAFTEFNGEPHRHLVRLHGGTLAGAGQLEFAAPSFVARESEGKAVITVRRTGATSGSVAIDYATEPVTAEPFADYENVSGTLTFQEGETFQSFTVPILESTFPKPDRAVRLILSSPRGGATLGRQPAATLTLVADKDVVSFSQTQYQVSEGLAGQTAVVEVTRTGDLAGEVQVTLQISNGTAFVGQDYAASSAVLVFAPGESKRSVQIQILDDDQVEENETINLQLSNPQGNAVLALPRAILTVVDNDFAPGILSFASVPLVLSEGAGEASISVRRIGGHTGLVTVQYESRSRTAVAGEDFVPVQGTLAFAEGEIIKTFTLPIIDDTTVESDEVLLLVLSNPSGGALLGSPGTNLVTIVNNDLGAGSLDMSFDPGRGANGIIRSVRVQNDGRIWIGGDFTEYDRVPQARIARLHINGIFDETFQHSPGVDNPVTVAVPLPDGQVLIAGDFNSVGPVVRNRIARLNSNGSNDGAFNLPLGFSALVQTLTVQPDGKVVVGGFFDRASAAARNRIARLHPNGMLDAGFDPGAGPDQAVTSVALQSDTKIVIGGLFTTVNSLRRPGVARLNANGTVDSDFNPATGPNGPVYAVAVQNDGRILVAGQFTTFDGELRSGIARLQPSGRLDRTFEPDPAISNAIYATALQDDGKIIIAGDFIAIDGAPRNGIARLTDTGALDRSFDPGTGANGPILSVAVQPDGHILAAGQFTTINGIPRNGIARLLGDPTRFPSEIQMAFVLRLGGGRTQLLFNTQPGRVYTVEASNDLSSWIRLGTVLATGATGDFLDSGSSNFSHRFYRIGQSQ